jgi:hypothetical protein
LDSCFNVTYAKKFGIILNALTWETQISECILFPMWSTHVPSVKKSVNKCLETTQFCKWDKKRENEN